MDKGWLLAEFERAKQRQTAIPEHARPVIVRGSLSRKVEMDSIHDTLCWASRGGLGCICKDLRAARADERERIARAIEYAYTSDYSCPAIRAYEDAARIARRES